MHPWPEPIRAIARQNAKSQIPLVARARRELGVERPLEQWTGGLYAPLADWIAQRAGERTLVTGICGAQGTGKTTLCHILQRLLQADGLRTAIVSLDDLYLPAARRLELAERVHPLLATRGVPGTHDIALGDRVLRTLCESRAGTKFTLPRFDKATDDRIAGEQWPIWEGRCDVVLFEGWCVGARPQPKRELEAPVNELEAVHDPNGSWRWYVNRQLGGAYQALFSHIEILCMLVPPDFDHVIQWRQRQEAQLRQRQGTARTNRVMTEDEVRSFVMHFERLTRAMASEMPERADVVLELDTQQVTRRVRLPESL